MGGRELLLRKVEACGLQGGVIILGLGGGGKKKKKLSNADQPSLHGGDQGNASLWVEKERGRI